MLEDHRSLPQIVDEQTRQHDGEPGQSDRRGANVTHVGVEGLGARDRQDDSAHRDEGHPGSFDGEEDRPVRGQGRDDEGLADDPRDAQGGQGEEPDTHHRPEGRDDDAEQHCRHASALAAGHKTTHQGHKREDAALTVVVSTHHEDDVLDAHHQQDRSEDHRDDPHDVTVGGANGMVLHREGSRAPRFRCHRRRFPTQPGPAPASWLGSVQDH